MSPSLARDVPALLRALVDSDPGRPRVTCYGPGPERIELSARVLDNWVAKTANLLVEELDTGPGTRVLVNLPAHWRTLVWLLATWSVGAQAVVAGAGEEEVDVIVSSEPPARSRTPVVAVPLAGLARSFPGLPAGALDYAAQVAGYDDLFVPTQAPGPDDVALHRGGSAGPAGAVAYGTLLERAHAAAGSWQAGARVLTWAGPADAVDCWLAPLTVDGSLVLLTEPRADEDAVDRIAAAEQVTDRTPDA